MTPDHEAAKKWAEQIPKQATVSADDENLSRAYLDAMAQLDKAEKMRDVASCARTDEPNLIAALREAVVALEGLHEYWNRDPNENAMHDACENTIEVADRTLATIAKLLKGEKP